jgi:hypothetical protein
MNNTWVKLHRNIVDWEWFDDKNALKLLIYLNVKVNIVDKQWKGITVKRGSLVTGKYSITEDLGISVQQYRTALKKLVQSGEIVKKSTNAYTILTLTKWEKMQHEQQTDNKRITNEQQTDNKRIYPTKESKEREERKESKEKQKESVFNFRKELLNLGGDEQLVSDWLLVRNKKKAANTKTALNGFLKQVKLTGKDLNFVLEKCVVSNWSGFKSEWLGQTNSFSVNKPRINTNGVDL